MKLVVSPINPNDEAYLRKLQNLRKRVNERGFKGISEEAITSVAWDLRNINYSDFKGDPELMVVLDRQIALEQHQAKEAKRLAWEEAQRTAAAESSKRFDEGLHSEKLNKYGKVPSKRNHRGRPKTCHQLKMKIKGD